MIRRSLLESSSQVTGLRSEREFGMLDGEVGILLIRSSWLTPMSTDEVALR